MSDGGPIGDGPILALEECVSGTEEECGRRIDEIAYRPAVLGPYQF